MYRLYGGLGSPYSVKMRAVLRYRRLPHLWLAGNGPDAMAKLFSQLKAPVIPVLEFPDGTVMNDSTPLIRELERRNPAERSIVADEWGTKAMFLYRWHRERDQAQMSRWLAFDRMIGRGRERIETAAQTFRERQVGRMALVGCTPQNAPLIEATALKAFELLDEMATQDGYLFGTRPSLADFGWYGQFFQLASDPTPHDVMQETAPYLMRWIANLDDASGVEGAWRDPAAEPSAAVTGLLKMAGEIYLPFLIANARAVAAGQESFTVELWGHAYTQVTFRYQAKCLGELRAAYGGLSAAARAKLDPRLEAAGVREGLAGAAA
jgi:glutathione S-transferase